MKCNEMKAKEQFNKWKTKHSQSKRWCLIDCLDSHAVYGWPLLVAVVLCPCLCLRLRLRTRVCVLVQAERTKLFPGVSPHNSLLKLPRQKNLSSGQPNKSITTHNVRRIILPRSSCFSGHKSISPFNQLRSLSSLILSHYYHLIQCYFNE